MAEEYFGTTAFVIGKSFIDNYNGLYFRLFKSQSAVDPLEVKEKLFLDQKGRFVAKQNDFLRIPGTPIAYWLGENLISAFSNSSINNIGAAKQGLATGDNERFLRFWEEVSFSNIGFNAQTRAESVQTGCKWFPCNKGGAFRKWYGNNDYVVNWFNDGQEIRNFKGENGKLKSRPQNMDYYFREGITWSTLSIGQLSMRVSPRGHLFETKGSVIFFNDPSLSKYVLGLVNSKVVNELLKVLCPTVDFHEGPISKLPVILNTTVKSQVDNIVEQNIYISKTDWDSFESSWGFQRHPLIQPVSTIEEAFAQWKVECSKRFDQLKANEEELNRIFIDIYGLQDELVPEVEDKDVTVRKADLQRDIKSLLSYAVGCMFGRYSLDTEGLSYAGGDWDESKYKTFLPDVDGILPITDEEYLGDDIVTRLCSWLKVVYGEDTLEENLDFIAKALGGRGNSSREIIRSYFLKDFFKDHCKTYQKRPIYWLFDSGKQNGFKALIYLHRYTPDTIGNLRVDYLHKMQRVYESEIGRMQDMIDHSTNAREVAAATKRKEKLQKQLKECRDYDEMIAHLALSRIELDLDDGVKVNYEKIQTASDGKKYSVLAKI